MYINQIIWKTSDIRNNMMQSKYIYQQENIILHYSMNGVYSKPYVDYPKEKFNKEDEYGRYYESTGGAREYTAYPEFMNIYNKDGKKRGIKYYSHLKKKLMGSIWDDCSVTRKAYPTQKPWRLLERIINLSTI